MKILWLIHIWCQLSEVFKRDNFRATWGDTDPVWDFGSFAVCHGRFIKISEWPIKSSKIVLTHEP